MPNDGTPMNDRNAWQRDEEWAAEAGAADANGGERRDDAMLMGSAARRRRSPRSFDEDAEPARLSPAAAAALLLVLAAVVMGCGGGVLTAGVALGLPFGAIWGVWGVWLAPVVSLFGVVLGLTGLRRIRLSDGAVVGKPMALIGVFVGLGVTAILGAVALAGLATLMGPRAMAPELTRLLIAGGEGRFADARGALGESADANIDDSDIAWFVARIEEEVGAIERASAELSVIAESRRVLASTPGAADADITVEEMPKPLWVIGERGRVLVYAWPDERALRENDVRIRDVLVILEAGEAATLRFPGPGQVLSFKLKWRTQHPDKPEGAGDGGRSGASHGDEIE
jgi:hypothetical protein